MSEKIKGITVVIDGDSKGLYAALNNVRKETNEIQKELGYVQKLLKLDPKNTELLAQKEKLLGDQIEITKNKLNGLKEAQQKASEDMKNGLEVDQKEYRRLQREILETENELKNLTVESNKFTQAGRSIQGVGNKLTEAGQKGMKFTGIVTGAAAGLAAATEANREYREDINRLEAAFTTAGKTVEDANQAYHDFYVILGEEDRSVEAVNHLAKLCNNQEELAKWSDICAGVSATFGDSLPIEGLTEAANETAKVSKVTGPLSDALNWAGISEDAFNEALKKTNSEQERSALITNTLQSVYQNAATEFRTLNADVIANREAVSDFNNQIAELSAQLEPILTKIKTSVTQILKWFNGLSEGSQKAIVGITGITAAVPPLLIGAGNTTEAVGKITEALGKSKIATEGFSGALKSMASVIMAHPVLAAIAFSAAAVGIAYACDESAQEVVRLQKESKRLVDETQSLIAETDRAESSISAESSTINDLIDKLYELEGQENKTNEEKEQMQSIVAQLNSMIPNLNLAIDAETGHLNQQRGTVQGLANDYINLAYAKAYAAQLESTVSKKLLIEGNNKELERQTAELADDLTGGTKGWSMANFKRNTASLKYAAIKKSYEENAKNIALLDNEINELSAKAAEYQAKINTNSSTKTDPWKSYGFSGSGGGGSTKSSGGSKSSGSSSAKSAADESKKQFEEEYKLLKYYLQNQEISEEEYYFKLGKLRDNYLDQGTESYRTYTTEIIQGYRDIDFRNLKYNLDMGYIEESEYYDQLAQLRDTYYLEGSKEWQNYTVEIANYQKKAAEDAAESIKSAIKEVSDEMNQQLDEVYSKRDSLADKLKSERSLLTGSDGIYNLTDFKKANQSIADYAKARTELAGRLQSLLGDRYSDFMTSVLGGTQEEGRIAAYILNNMTEENLRNYISEWSEYQQHTEDFANDAYSAEIAEIKDNYFEEILKIPEEMQDKFEACGKSMADFMSTGFVAQFEQMIQTIKDMIPFSIPSLPVNAISPLFGHYGNNVDNSKTTTFNQQISVNGDGSNLVQAGKRLFNAIMLSGVL